MDTRDWSYQPLVVIAVTTVASGLLQLVAPGRILALLRAQRTPASRHFFGIVGMFMSLFGGLLLQALLKPEGNPPVLFWTSLQKFGASIAVGLGVRRKIFSALALAVAGFDFLSGPLLIRAWRRGRNSM